MSIFLKKQRTDILNQALQKLKTQTPVTATSAGTIARAITEGITSEIGNLYDVLDYNVSQSVISTATGAALDNIGILYGVKRMSVSQFTAVDRLTGSFYFYIDTPHVSDIVIPAGTRVYTDISGFIGAQIFFTTTNTVTIPSGATKVYAGLQLGNNSLKNSVGPNTLIRNDAESSVSGITILCTNPKSISPTPSMESDNDFRTRIIKSIRVSAGGTEQAVRFALLAVSGVRDVVVNSAAYGLGSAEVLVVTENAESSNTVLAAVNQQLDTVRPVGVNMVISTPKILATDIYITIIFNGGLSQTEKSNVSLRVKSIINTYLNSLLPGDTLVYNRLIQKILDSSDSIKDLQITRYAPNGVETARRNFTPKNREQIVPGRIQITAL